MSKRYFLVIPCQITILKSGESYSTHIINISRTGVFLETNDKLPENSAIILTFSFKDVDYELKCKHISNHKIIDSNGVGAQFIFNKFHGEAKATIDHLIEEVKNYNPPTPSIER